MYSDLAWANGRAVDKADAMLTLSSALAYNIGSHLPFLNATRKNEQRQTQTIPERQRARVSKITNDCLTRSGTGCLIAVPVWRQWASKG